MNKRKYKRIEKPYMARLRIKQFKPTSMFTISIKFIDIGEQQKEMINTTVENALE